MDEIVWEEPPEDALVIGTGRASGKYREFAKALQKRPGKWAVLPSDSKSESGAKNTAMSIRKGKIKGFAPGQYDSAVLGTRIWVRFSPKGGQPKEQAADTNAIRAWARSNGMSVPDRGRLPDNVIAAYRER